MFVEKIKNRTYFQQSCNLTARSVVSAPARYLYERGKRKESRYKITNKGTNESYHHPKVDT